jgi:hypothetical protein
MALVGLDLNATRARAVARDVGDFPATVLLRPSGEDLPLSISLAGSALEVGTAGLKLCRRLPHLVYQNFLAAVGETQARSRGWLQAPRRLDANQAAAAVLHCLGSSLRHGDGVVVAVPDYLAAPQVELLIALAGQTHLPLIGSMSSSLAAALAAYAEQSWFGSVILIDLDDHALWLATVQEADGQAHLLDTVAYPQLSLSAWRTRLLNALADCCILQSRRDPRDCAAAEQHLYEQLEGILDDCKHGRLSNVVFQTEHWLQNLVLQPKDTEAFCAGMVRQVLIGIERVFGASWAQGPPRVVLLSAAAGILPGLAAALHALIEARFAAAQSRDPAAEDDFGVNLLEEGAGDVGSVVVLSPDAAARGAHSTAAHFQRGDLPHRHLDSVAPLPLPQPPEAGPPRLQFQGQDYVLRQRSFTLGRQTDCDLVFDRAMYPGVSPLH